MKTKASDDENRMIDKAILNTYRGEYRDAALQKYTGHAASSKICGKIVNGIKIVAGTILLGSTFYAGGHMLLAGSGFAEAVIGLGISMGTVVCSVPFAVVGKVSEWILAHHAEKELKAGLKSGVLKQRYENEKISLPTIDMAVDITPEKLSKNFPSLNTSIKAPKNTMNPAKDLSLGK